ncbi:MAG: large-conductance mechanosensitive channel protein MscL [Bacteroidota bacterium]|jgi:large conductance mechanosensitive channel|nr:large-conductance mechanosensitive channel protein MscL [Bacteroidales bacterium]MDI9536028.1 large-conductance mechanosensitive channel protein MscL [Bacteroidota bacterium]OQC44372.1 MAG: Large-conductance mechanosensitive channel [Bacteroidetes bacterium ADurb.Bin028]NLP20827.1 large-conductance mechanosensitive channel protein MscL [Bacteroidales bacterium]HNY44045.1 large-conductance mechanosensitive channel protein MscL [Bacteroidales bacterium]
MLKEFRDFAIKGNLIDMAIGIIIGAAFGKVVASLVADVIMPPIGLLIGGVNFTDLTIVLKEAVGDNPAVTLNYGNFIQILIDFLIVAMAIFIVIKGINALKRKEEKEPEPEPEPEPTKEEILLTEIRDLLKEGRKE